MRDAGFQIRPCRPGDEDGVYEVCLKTGDSGQDGSRLYAEDPKALGHIFVGPYMALEPELAFVLADQLGVCGYVLAALDSKRFYQRYREEWLPPLRAKHPEPAGDATQWTPTQSLFHQYHHPDIYLPESFAPYPSHLHIDLLPRAQGQGHGVRMVQLMLRTLAGKGSPGVHLGLSSVNARAFRFYTKLGFMELARAGAAEPQVVYMGRKLP